MINPTNPAERERMRMVVLRSMIGLENKGARDLQPILNRQFLLAAKFVENGITFIDPAVDKERAAMVRVFQEHYRRTAAVFNGLAMRGVEDTLAPKKSFVLDNPGEPGGAFLELKGPKEAFWQSVNGWINTQAAQKVTNVGRTTKKRIAGIIGSGMREGLSNRDIAKNLREIRKIATPRRARNIARNETHTAAVHSVDESMKSTKIQMEREWAPTPDERVRIEHAAMVAHPRVGMEEPFTVGGEKLMYPGDPKGSGWNTILCRCVVMYHVIKGLIVAREPVKPPEELSMDPGDFSEFPEPKTIPEKSAFKKGEECLAYGEKHKREMSHMIDQATGSSFPPVEGEKTSVSIRPQIVKMKPDRKYTWVHNHPTKDQMPFSDDDLLILGTYKPVSEIRAVTDDFIFVAKKTDNFIKGNFDVQRFRSDWKAMHKQLVSRWIKSKKNYTEISRGITAEVNKQLAKRYKYTFEIWRRPGVAVSKKLPVGLMENAE